MWSQDAHPSVHIPDLCIAWSLKMASLTFFSSVHFLIYIYKIWQVPSDPAPTSKYYSLTVPISWTHATISLADTKSQDLETLCCTVWINQELHIMLHLNHCWQKFRGIKRDLLDCDIMTRPKIPPWHNSHVIGTVACIITTSICLQVHSKNEFSQNCTLSDATQILSLCT